MTEWDLNTQRMLDFIELHLAEPLTLAQVARRLGYSPWYCTRRFRQVRMCPRWDLNPGQTPYKGAALTN